MRPRAAGLPASFLLFILTSAFQTRSPIALQTTETLNLNSNDDARTTYKELARRGGLNVAFTPQFVANAPAPMRAANVTVAEALDLLSKQTRNFWVTWDSGIVLVAPDTPANRRDYDRQFLAVLSLRGGATPADIDQLVARLKGLQIRVVVPVADKILVRADAAGIQTAPKTAEDFQGAFHIETAVLPSSPSVFLTDGGTSHRSPASKRSGLRVPSLGAISLNIKDTNRAIYEKLADIAGLHLVFHRNYPSRPVSLEIENLDFFDALDLLSAQTRSFWQPIGDKTIVVFEDTPQNRRDFELHTMETIYLSEGTTEERLAAVVNALRTALFQRGIYSYPPRRAIVLHDTPDCIELAEDLIAALQETPTVSKALVTEGNTAFAEMGTVFYSAATTRAAVKANVSTLQPFSREADVRTVYEVLGRGAGVSVVFGPRFPTRSVNFHVADADFVDALDLLAFQTGTFWQALDEHTILVQEDTQQNRRDYEVHLVKTILLPVQTTPAELNGLMNVLRTAFSLRGIYQSAATKAIVIHDTPSRVALVEKIIRQLIPSPESLVVLSVPAPGMSETRLFQSAPVERSRLEFKASSPISMQVNQDSRSAYEILAAMGGIKVTFDSRFSSSSPATLNLWGRDIPEALDTLSLQTGNYWTVLDSKSILVLPDTPQVRRESEASITRTVAVKSLTPGAAADFVNILRTALGMRQVESNGAFSIVITDVPARIAIAEQVLANIDRL